MNIIAKNNAKIKPLYVQIHFTECSKTLGGQVMSLEEFNIFVFNASKRAGKGYIKTDISVIMSSDKNYNFTMQINETTKSLKDHVNNKIVYLIKLISQLENNERKLKNTELAIEIYKHELEIMHSIEF